MVGPPRRGIPLPASSPSSRLRVAAPSPRKSPGLQQSMEDGGEVEGTLRCSNKPSIKQSRMAGEAVETAEKALSAGTGDNTTLVASASRSEKQQAGLSGSSAGASSTAPASPAVAGEATPEPGSQPWPSASAALAEAAAGGGQQQQGRYQQRQALPLPPWLLRPVSVPPPVVEGMATQLPESVPSDSHSRNGTWAQLRSH